LNERRSEKVIKRRGFADEGCVLVFVLLLILGVVAGLSKGCSNEPQRVEAAPVAEGPSLPFFDVGSVPFWFLTITLVVLLTMSVEWEQGVLGLIAILLYLATLQWRGHLDIIHYVDTHRIETMYAFLAFWAVGVLVAFGKWYLYCLNIRYIYLERRTAWLESRGVEDTSSIPDKYKDTWIAHVESSNIEVGTKARNHKTRIIRWICYWPIVLIWSLLDDFIKHMGTLIYRQLAGLFQRVSNSVWRGVDDDFRKGSS
jgi:hypothetical protein